jgi:hypothetical protein
VIAQPSQHPTWTGTRRLALLALALQGWIIVSVGALHWLRPDLPPAEHRISEYALGPFGQVMITVFAASALGKLLLVLALLRDGPKTWPARGAETLLKVSILGVLLTAFCPVDPTPESASLLGVLHDTGFALNVLTSVLAAALLTMSFTLDPRWQPILGLSLVLTLALGAEIFLAFRSIGGHAPWGLVNRAYALTSVLWMSATAVRLLVVARS